MHKTTAGHAGNNQRETERKRIINKQPRDGEERRHVEQQQTKTSPL